MPKAIFYLLKGDFCLGSWRLVLIENLISSGSQESTDMCTHAQKQQRIQDLQTAEVFAYKTSLIFWWTYAKPFCKNAWGIPGTPLRCVLICSTTLPSYGHTNPENKILWPLGGPVVGAVTAVGPAPAAGPVMVEAKAHCSECGSMEGLGFRV